MSRKLCILAALACFGLGCELTSGSSKSKSTSDTASEPANDCPKVDENINYPEGKPGTWTKAGSLCAGKLHKYSVNVGCDSPGKPACGTCSVSGTLTYSDSDAKFALEIWEENGGGTKHGESAQSASPKTASAEVKYGGTFSARVRNTGSTKASYSVDIVYGCP